MILSGLEIERNISLHNINIVPYCKSRLNPNSYNLRLHDTLLVYDDDVLDMKKENTASEIVIPPEGLVLQPNKLYLGRTLEYTSTFNCVPMLEGRSSVGRLGLFIHATAGFGDVGFCGFWTLEMSYIKPIRIYAGVEVCQIYYHTIKGRYESYAGGKYQANTGIQPSFLFRDFKKD